MQYKTTKWFIEIDKCWDLKFMQDIIKRHMRYNPENKIIYKNNKAQMNSIYICRTIVNVVLKDKEEYNAATQKQITRTDLANNS